MPKLKVVKPSPPRVPEQTYGVTVHVEITSFKKGVIDQLAADLEHTGWGSPMGRVIKHGLTTLTYHLEVDV